jgi:hypothetical protein
MRIFIINYYKLNNIYKSFIIILLIIIYKFLINLKMEIDKNIIKKVKL